MSVHEHQMFRYHNALQKMALVFVNPLSKPWIKNSAAGYYIDKPNNHLLIELGFYTFL